LKSSGVTTAAKHKNEAKRANAAKLALAKQ